MSPLCHDPAHCDPHHDHLAAAGDPQTLAPVVGVSQKTVHRAWQAHRLKPHRPRTFQLSRDPQFVEKLTDVVALYLNPPDKALVFCADEKSQIRTLDHTQLGLPLKKGRGATMTHDYKRHGTRPCVPRSMSLRAS